ncbi:hypothetical protein ACOMHN_007665 [Nucella lapillus]
MHIVWMEQYVTHSRSVYFHLRDTSNTPGCDSSDYDPLYKIRPFLDMIQPLFKKHYKPGRDLSSDDSMVGYKEKLFFNQYMPAKPVKLGIKVWQLCDAQTGCCVAFDIYIGRHSRQDSHATLVEEVVNIQSSTIRPGIFFILIAFSPQWPSCNACTHMELCNSHVKQERAAYRAEGARIPNRGDLLQMQQGPLVAIVYRDKHQIHLLNTKQPLGKTVTETKEIPTFIAAYSKYTGGIDKCDQYMAYYPVGK